MLDLRHTAAVTMLASGVALEKVSQVSGHSNTAVTFSTLGPYLPEHMQDAVNVLVFMKLKASLGFREPGTLRRNAQVVGKMVGDKGFEPLTSSM
jgi:hypothetical protein